MKNILRSKIGCIQNVQIETIGKTNHEVICEVEKRGIGGKLLFIFGHFGDNQSLNQLEIYIISGRIIADIRRLSPGNRHDELLTDLVFDFLPHANNARHR